jgi:hypothetical protein
MRAVVSALLLGTLIAACSNTQFDRARFDAEVDPSQDADRDTIADLHDGPDDPDLDGDANYVDTDSDGDGIDDATEAGDADPSTPPVDSDADGTPDFLDLDSDQNGIPDAREERGDTDGDGTPDFADADDDGDLLSDIIEIGAEADAPVDFGGDGLPDYRDPDSDGDTILDGQERDVDTDRDGRADMHDDDSDADGVPDAQEAGDSDLATPPVDTDADFILDFRDPDSDADGLADGLERELGTDRARADSDGDGVSDLIEVGAGTGALDAEDNPRVRGDFVFVAPYEGPPEPLRDTLRFTTDVQLADVYFLFDKSGSMTVELDSMRAAVRGILENLTCADSGIACANDFQCAGGRVCSLAGTCIEDPAATECIPSLWTGVGVYGGSSPAYPIANVESVSADPAATEAAIPTAVGVYGSDETMFQAAACTANPTLCPSGRTSGCATSGIGCAGYRADALRILVLVTDEANEYVDAAFTAESAGLALRSAGITFVGVDADVLHEGQADLRALARGAGSFGGAGAELVYDGDEAAVVTAVTDAIVEIAHEVPFRATIAAEDLPDDDGDALPFIARLETNTAAAGCTLAPDEDTNADDAPDAFPSVRPGTPVCWDVVPAPNTTVVPALRPLVFRAEISVSGDGSPLDVRRVYFLVPPRIPDPGLE